MLLRLDEFNVGICTRTGVRYRWTGEKWVVAHFQSEESLRIQKVLGINLENSIEALILECRIKPPNELIENISVIGTSLKGRSKFTEEERRIKRNEYSKRHYHKNKKGVR